MTTAIKLTGVEEALKQYDPDIVRQALRSAVKKIGQQTINFISNRIRKDFNIPPGRLKDHMVFHPLSLTDMSAAITGRGLGIPLINYGAKQSGVSVKKSTGEIRLLKRAIPKGRGGQVTAEVKHGNRKPVSPDPHPAFISKMKSGHLGVFVRLGKSRIPIKQLYGPGVAGLLGNSVIFADIKTFVNDKFDEVFTHELEYYSSKK